VERVEQKKSRDPTPGRVVASPQASGFEIDANVRRWFHRTSLRDGALGTWITGLEKAGLHSIRRYASP
jgi:hypothetical protein